LLVYKATNETPRRKQRGIYFAKQNLSRGMPRGI